MGREYGKFDSVVVDSIQKVKCDSATLSSKIRSTERNVERTIAWTAEILHGRLDYILGCALVLLFEFHCWKSMNSVCDKEDDTEIQYCFTRSEYSSSEVTPCLCIASFIRFLYVFACVAYKIIFQSPYETNQNAKPCINIRFRVDVNGFDIMKTLKIIKQASKKWKKTITAETKGSELRCQTMKSFRWPSLLFEFIFCFHCLSSVSLVVGIHSIAFHLLCKNWN